MTVEVHKIARLFGQRQTCQNTETATRTHKTPIGNAQWVKSDSRWRGIGGGP